MTLRVAGLFLLTACVPELNTLAPGDAGPADAADVGTVVTSSDRQTIAPGETHTCAVSAGNLYCWGSNDFGEGGQPGGSQTSAVLIDDTRTWVEVSGRGRFSCGRTSDGQTYCWGQNTDGQIGNGTFVDQPTPLALSGLPPAASVRAGYNASCIVDTSGVLHCWGQDFEGQLGIGSPPDGADQPRPTRVSAGWTGALDMGGGHTCAARGTELMCWGRNTQRQLGLGPGAFPQFRVPTRVDGISARSVATAPNTTCSISIDRALYCWGESAAGSLGLGDVEFADTPTLVDEGPFDQVTSDAFHTCAIGDGRLFCWGRNIEGQLGLGDLADRRTPTLVGTTSDWVEVRAGRFHTCGRRSNDTIWCTGANDGGRLGVGDGERRNEMTKVVLP